MTIPASILNPIFVCAPFLSYLELNLTTLAQTFVFINNHDPVDAQQVQQSYSFRIVFEPNQVVVYHDIYFPVYDPLSATVVLRSITVAFVLIDYPRNLREPNKTIRENFVLYMAIDENLEANYQPFMYSLDMGQYIPRTSPPQLPSSFSRIIAVLNYPRPFYVNDTTTTSPQQITVVQSVLGTTSFDDHQTP